MKACWNQSKIDELCRTIGTVCLGNRYGRTYLIRFALMLLTVSCGVRLIAQSPQEMLKEGVQEYQAALDEEDRDSRLARFGRAEMLFEHLVTGDSQISTQSASAELLVNLGNAALGAERLGPAINAYRRALVIDPNHSRARQNLQHARTLLPEWVPKPTESGRLDNFLLFFASRTPEQLRLIAACVFLLAAISLAAALRWGQGSLRALAMVAIVVWVGMIVVLFWNSRSTHAEQAVVIVPEVVARSADAAGAPPRLPQPLPSGTEVEILDYRDQWLRVRLADGRDVWLPAGSIARVSP